MERKEATGVKVSTSSLVAAACSRRRASTSSLAGGEVLVEALSPPGLQIEGLEVCIGRRFIGF